MIPRTVLAALLVCIVTAAFGQDQKARPAANQDDSISHKLSERLGPYIQTVFSYSENDPKGKAWREKYERLTVDEKVRYCIFQLRDESWYENPVFLSDEPYSTRPEATASRELIKLGRPAIPQLILALDSRVPTKIYPQRLRDDPWLVQDAAMDAIERIACRLFGGERYSYELSDVDKSKRQELRQSVADWWKGNQGSDEVKWAKAALFSDAVVPGESRWMATDSLYLRLGKESYPLLAKAYDRLPTSREDADAFDETMWGKVQILQWLLRSPSLKEKAVFASAVHDSSLRVRIDGAEGLWAISDPSGLQVIVKDVEERLLNDRGSVWLNSDYRDVTSFLVRCNTSSSREAVYQCLRGRNPYLRQNAIGAVPSLHLEKAVRALPELFDDPFVLSGSYIQGDGKTERTVPPRRVCDVAAASFTEVVPNAPRFLGETAAEQQSSIEKLKQWWNENNAHLKWDEKSGVLTRPK